MPVIREADKKTLEEIVNTMEELIKKAREGGLSVSEVTKGSFTITNLGMFGVDSFIAIINPGQAAIMATGEIRNKPKVVDERIEIKRTATLSPSFDYRILDGAFAAKFLGRVKSILEGNLEELT